MGGVAKLITLESVTAGVAFVKWPISSSKYVKFSMDDK